MQLIHVSKRPSRALIHNAIHIVSPRLSSHRNGCFSPSKKGQWGKYTEMFTFDVLRAAKITPRERWPVVFAFRIGRTVVGVPFSNGT